MLFYEFFKSNIGTEITIMLKTGIHVFGVLTSVDPYLNMKLQDVKILNEHPGLDGVFVCSVRGSSIKYVLIENSENFVENINASSRLRMILDRY